MSLTVQEMRLETAGRRILIRARPSGWPAYFDGETLAVFRALDWYARRQRLLAHDCYLTAARVFVGSYSAASGGQEEKAQREVIAAVWPGLAQAFPPLPPAAELSFNRFAGHPDSVTSPGFLTPSPVEVDGRVLRSIWIDP